MRTSEQDDYYVTTEADHFFERIQKGNLASLRPNKITIYDAIKESGIQYDNVLEFGCNYGDLINEMYTDKNAKNCMGVEASLKAVNYGKKLYGRNIKLIQGTIANNEVNDSNLYNAYFDLLIIDDVFGWVSRETILQSIANVDTLLNQDGCVFIRDFYPDKRVMNKNHHVANGSVYNYKVPHSHASILVASGMYEVQWQKIYFDKTDMSSGYKCDNLFNYRWIDVVLRKSTNTYFNESVKLD